MQSNEMNETQVRKKKKLDPISIESNSINFNDFFLFFFFGRNKSKNFPN